MSDKSNETLVSENIEVLSEAVAYQGFFQILTKTVNYPLFAGGMSGPVTREVFERGDAVVVLPYDPVRDEVVLIQQLRVPVIGKSDNPWLYELAAGMIEPGESELEVAHRELEEETGLTATKMLPINRHFSSPGGTSERLQLFLAIVDAANAKGIHGLEDENEDIRVQVVTRELAYEWVEQGKIDNASSVIGLQWLQLHHQQVRSEA